MKRLFASKYLLSAALAVAALAAVSSAPAFAQSVDHFGSMLPHYFNGAGEEIWGSWGPPTTQQQAAQPSRRLYMYVNPHASRSRGR